MGYAFFNLFYGEQPSSKISKESEKVINIIKNATDEINRGAPIRSKRGVLSSNDYDFIMNYYKEYKDLLSEDFKPENHGYTSSEQKLVEYVINLFVRYVMNEQFIYGDMKFASFLLNSLYEDLEKAPMYFYLVSKNELKDIGTAEIEEEDSTEGLNQDYESNKKRYQETNIEDQMDTRKTEDSSSYFNQHDTTIDSSNEEPQNESPNNYYDLSEKQKNELQKQVKEVLGEDFIFNPNEDYDTTNWTDEMLEAIMTAETLYYVERGMQSPYD